MFPDRSLLLLFIIRYWIFSKIITKFIYLRFFFQFYIKNATNVNDELGRDCSSKWKMNLRSEVKSKTFWRHRALQPKRCGFSQVITLDSDKFSACFHSTRNSQSTIIWSLMRCWATFTVILYKFLMLLTSQMILPRSLKLWLWKRVKNGFLIRLLNAQVVVARDWLGSYCHGNWDACMTFQIDLSEVVSK